MNIRINGVDPSGTRLPDEVLYHPDNGDRMVELLRDMNRWMVRDITPKGTSASLHEEFEPAFLEFCQIVDRLESKETALRV